MKNFYKIYSNKIKFCKRKFKFEILKYIFHFLNLKEAVDEKEKGGKKRLFKIFFTELKQIAKTFMAMVAILITMSVTSLAYAEDDIEEPRQIDWPFDGAFGKFDRVAIQRGFQVYREVCSACHSMKRIAFRNLEEIGFSEEEVKAIASEYSVVDGPDDEGEMFERPGRPSDYFPQPYPNEKAARAANNNNALPPDLSLIIKAREDGANYVYSLLTGYEDPPSYFELGENMYYNPYFAGGGKQFSMTPPLAKDGMIEYQGDSIEPTIEQMAYDIVNFLQWAAEPEMEERKGLGFKTIVFLIIFTLMFYLLKKQVWKRIK